MFAGETRLQLLLLNDGKMKTVHYEDFVERGRLLFFL
jgi:hypothetical protein